MISKEYVLSFVKDFILNSKIERTLVLGDVHGNYKALKQVFDRCNFDPEKDFLISLGDLVDGGKESSKVIDYFIALKDFCNIEPVFIKGNHDVFLADWLETDEDNIHWLSIGGQETVDSYFDVDEETRLKHLEFLNAQVDYAVDSKGRAFVHGGFQSKKGLGYDLETVYRWDRSLWDKAMMRNKAPMYKEVYIGHTATNNWNIKRSFREYSDVNQPKKGGIVVPMNRANVWNIDTGAGWGGRLTIMDIDTKKYWQSDNINDL